MKIMKIFFFLAMLISGLLHAQADLTGSSYTELSNDKNTDETYFENWTEVIATSGKFRLGMRYEVHNPPLSFSPEKVGNGFYQNFVEYQDKNYQVTFGNFYSMLGRGLVLRSFENRTLRWDTNIEGLRFYSRHSKVETKVIIGKPRDRQGNRLKTLHAGEIKFKPLQYFNAGGTFLKTKTLENQDISWGSAFSTLNFSWINFYGEYAKKEAVSDNPEGKAIYMAADVFVKDLSLRSEYKNYDNFHLARGSYYDYNNPPTVVREHLYTLLNRHQHVMNTNNEIGLLFEAGYPVGDLGIVTANYNRTTNRDYREVYREYYGQFEMDYPEDWAWVFAAGHEKDLEARYLNFVNSTSWSMSDYNSLKVIYEHQHARIHLTDRKFYSQILLLGFSRAPYFTFSVIGEKTTEQTSDKDYWLGAQVDAQYKEKYDVTVFAGTRREGKICAGGVCVYKPEFEGIELILKIRL
ncbi:MAG: hypothetical protein KAR38_03200 [Calditrichia bacterium]|nr:hypothetical protein [Calditrichia bacterium]